MIISLQEFSAWRAFCLDFMPWFSFAVGFVIQMVDVCNTATLIDVNVDVGDGFIPIIHTIQATTLKRLLDGIHCSLDTSLYVIPFRNSLVKLLFQIIVNLLKSTQTVWSEERLRTITKRQRVISDDYWKTKVKNVKG